MSELKVNKIIVLNAEINTVWDALTKPQWTKRYMLGIEVISDWKVGSPILWKGRLKGDEKIIMKGSIEKIEAGKLLQFTTLDLNANYNDVPSNYVKATYELTPSIGKTILSVTKGDYTHVTNGAERYNVDDGALSLTLNALKLLFEKNV